MSERMRGSWEESDTQVSPSQPSARGLTKWTLIALSCALLAAGIALGTAVGAENPIDNPIRVENVSVNRDPFSPNGDGVRDDTTIRYTLSSNATVTVTITDGGGVPVRTLKSSLIELQGNRTAVWDGTNDSYVPVAAGTYAYEIHASDAAGTSDIADGTVVVAYDYVSMLQPTAGQTLSGTAVFCEAVEGTYFDGLIESDKLYFQWRKAGTSSWYSLPNATRVMHPTGPDTWEYEWDTTTRPDGEYEVRAAIDIGPGNEVTEPVPVTIDNPVSFELSNVSVNRDPFSPNGDGVRDDTTIRYTLSSDATVTVRVRDSGGSVIKTLRLNDIELQGSRSAVWDGTNDSYVPVAAGTYAYEIHASDAAGTSDIAGGTVVVAYDYVSMLQPTAGQTLFGTTLLVAEEGSYFDSLQYGGVTSDKLYFQWRKAGTSSWYSLPNATRVMHPTGPDTWEYEWDTTTRPDGEYEVRAAIDIGPGNEVTDLVTVGIVNEGTFLDDDFEPDDALWDASPIALGAPQSHTIAPEGDEDWVQFSATNGTEYSVSVIPGAGAFNAVVDVLDSIGPIASSNAGGTGEPESFTFTPDETGTHWIRVRDILSGTGAYTIVVDVVLDEGDAYEPDDTQGTANAIVLGATQSHTIAPEGDEDWAVFSATAGVTYSISADPAAGSSLTMAVEVHDEFGYLDGSQAGGPAQTATLSFTASTTGSYWICAFDAGEATGQYALAVEAVPVGGDSYEPDDTQETASSITLGSTQNRTIDPAGDEDWVEVDCDEGVGYRVRANVPAGSPLDLAIGFHDSDGAVDWIDEGVEGASESGIVGATETGAHWLQVYNYGAVTGSYTLSIERASDQYEPDNDEEQASVIAPGQTQARTIAPKYDEDWVVFTAWRGGAYRLDLDVPADSELDLVLEVESPTGWEYYEADDGISGEPESLLFVANEAGDYLIRVADDGERAGDYSLGLTEIPRDGYEPDDVTDDAKSIAADGVPQLRDLIPVGDKDTVSVDVKEGWLYVVDTVPADGSAMDLGLELLDEDGSWVADENQGWEGEPEHLVYEADYTGKLFIVVADGAIDPPVGGEYEISVEERHELVIPSSRLDFGELPVGQSSVKSVTITNPSDLDEPLELELTDAEYALLDSPSQVPANDSVQVRIEYAPQVKRYGEPQFSTAWSHATGYYAVNQLIFVLFESVVENRGGGGMVAWENSINGASSTGEYEVTAGDLYKVTAMATATEDDGSSIAWTPTLPWFFAPSPFTYHGARWTGTEAGPLSWEPLCDCSIQVSQTSVTREYEIELFGTVPTSDLDDTTDPVISVSGVTDGAIYDGAVTPAFSATDDTDPAPLVIATLNGAPFTSGTEVSTPGTYTLVVTATDDSGNSATETVTFEIESEPPADNTPPTVTSDAKATYVGSATIAISAADSGSGVKHVAYELDGADAVTVTGASASVGPVSALGLHTLTYWAEDNAGNESAHITRTFTVTDTEPPPEDVTSERLAGSDRYATAAALSREAFPDDGSAGDVIVASGAGFADALSASGLAGALKAPIILTPATGSVPSAVTSEISRVAAEGATVWVVGGDAAVSDAVAAALDVGGVADVERIYGADRYRTAAAVAAKVRQAQGAAFEGTAIVASGVNFPDALAASPVAYAQGFPVLLTQPETLTGATKGALADIDEAVIVGGTAAVSAAVAAQIDALPGTEVTRWAGPGRYETAAEIAKRAEGRGWVGYAYVGVASGENYPDALAGGPVAGSQGGIMLLVQKSKLPAATRSFLVSNKAEIETVQAYGGPAAIDGSVLGAIDDALK